MHENFIGVPALFFFSENDPVSTPEMNTKFYLLAATIASDRFFKKQELPLKEGQGALWHVYTKCWTDSVHVSHYLKHRQEYEEEVAAFLESLGMIELSRRRATSV
ncbi:hypothetical protein Hamer_G013756 [Homarus americanus]|uniref:Uncharacterized protein n=1 Tax=Homarus americanus TaxID=6706 RepID=A0A8J5KJB9_HOMAM|nr:hypothetical protein Hamer_G013756 [Homarus americanus]